MNELFYQDSYCKEFNSTVVSCTETKKGYEIVLTDTAFYPEGGGQPADHGTLNDAKVLDVHRKAGAVVHYTDRALDPGTEVHGVLDWDRRLDLMQQHTGEHIFSGIVHQNFGYENIGFHLGDDVITLDFSGPLTWEELREVEKQANDIVFAAMPVQITFPTAAELAVLDFRSKKELSGEVRIVTIPGADVCACCGTHLKSSAEVGMIKVLSCINKREGTRVTIVCGRRAFNMMVMLMEQNRNLSRLFSAKPEEVENAIVHFVEETVKLRQKMSRYISIYLANRVESYPDSDGLTIVFEDEIDAGELRRFCNDMIEHNKAKVCAGFADNGRDGYNYCFISKEINLRNYVKEINACINGRGGGTAELLQGSCKMSKIEIETCMHELFEI